MRRRTCVVFGLLAALLTGPSQAQAPKSAPIRAFDLPTIERLGRAIHRRDVAAARATDALLEEVRDPGAAKVVGWLVEEDGSDDRVRFLRDLGSGPEAGFDVAVPRRGAPKVATPADRRLTPDQRAAFAAVQTASRNTPRVCRPRYNSVVMKDVDGDGWLVWLLAPSPAAGAVPVGGHYRFTISADGGEVESRDALSTSCLTVDPRQGVPKGATPVGVVASHVVSPTPVETHVFLQLLYGLPMYVSAGGTTWTIDDGRIARLKRR